MSKGWPCRYILTPDVIWITLGIWDTSFNVTFVTDTSVGLTIQDLAQGLRLAMQGFGLSYNPLRAPGRKNPSSVAWLK